MAGACPNCSTDRVGRFCHTCGQVEGEADELTLRAAWRHVVEEVGALDFKTIRSLVALLRPGWLTREYLAGRRQSYLSPLRVYLVAAAIFFVAAPRVGLTFDALIAQGNSGQLTRMVEARIAERGLDRAHFADRFDLRLQTIYTLSLAVSVAAAAVLLALFYRRHRRPFGAHLVFSVHYVAFLYLAALLNSVLQKAAPSPLMALLLAHVIVGPYLALALRRVYGDSWPWTVAKVLVFFVITFVVDSTVNALAMLVTLFLV